MNPSFESSAGNTVKAMLLQKINQYLATISYFYSIVVYLEYLAS